MRGAMNRLDPRSPLVFDTRELSRRPGSMREVSRRIEAPAVLGAVIIAAVLLDTVFKGSKR